MTPPDWASRSLRLRPSAFLVSSSPPSPTVARFWPQALGSSCSDLGAIGGLTLGGDCAAASVGVKITAASVRPRIWHFRFIARSFAYTTCKREPEFPLVDAPETDQRKMP